jgi:uncharacterized damage-inducible protein DinB
VTTENCVDLPQLGGNHGQLEHWIAGLKAAREELETLLTDLPAAALAWQPLSTAQSIGSLLLQIAGSESFWLGEATEQNSKELLTNTAPSKPVGWYLDLIRTVRANTLHALSHSPSLDHVCERRKENGELERCTLRWVLWHLLEQEAHHRGQIELLKRWYQQAHAPVYA